MTEKDITLEELEETVSLASFLNCEGIYNTYFQMRAKDLFKSGCRWLNSLFLIYVRMSRALFTSGNSLLISQSSRLGAI